MSLRIRAESVPSKASEYELRELIGQGTCASVYRAWCSAIEEEVAIKVVNLDWFNVSFEEIARDINIMSLSSHPNVVPLSKAFVEGINLWIVMPLLIGGSVRSLMDCSYLEGLPEDCAIYVLWSVLKALKYFHGNGQIHRDVKCANTLLDLEGNVMLSDFGMMEWMDDCKSGSRERCRFFGTPCWMAPEVMRQTKGYDFKADVWALGITAIELAQGIAPNFGSPPIKIFLMTLEEPPPRLSDDVIARISSEYKDFVEKCLQKDPRLRPSIIDLLSHPLFRKEPTKPPAFVKAVSQLPPLGTREGSRAFPSGLTKPNSGPGASGIVELVSNGLGWDFSEYSESHLSIASTASHTPYSSVENFSPPNLSLDHFNNSVGKRKVRNILGRPPAVRRLLLDNQFFST